MSDIITTLHPENDENVNLYPNIKKDNIPDGSVDESKLSESVTDTLNGIDTRLSSAIASITQPKYYSSLPTSDVGLIVYSDGYIYSWNGTQYTSTGIVYQSTQIADGSVTNSKLANNSVDSSKLSGDLDEIFNEFNKVEGINRYNPSNAVLGRFVEKNGHIGVNSGYFYFTVKVPYNKKVVASYTNGTVRNLCSFTMAYVPIDTSKGSNTPITEFVNDFSNDDVEVTLSTVTNYNINFELNIIDKDAARTTASGYNKYSPYSDYYYLDAPRTFYVKKDGSGDFTKLIDGVLYASQFLNSILYVGDGEYDLINEFGSAYFNNMLSTDGYSGIFLKNNIHIIFSSNSKVVCNYTGYNQWVMKLFSPFNSVEGGFTLEGLNLECSRVRYAIHDEHYNSTTSYTNNYINCNIYIDNTNNTYWGSSRCIGGGLGLSGNINIENCTFETGWITEAYVLSYHNTGLDNAKSIINIKSCYVKGNKSFAFSYMGVSTKITNIYVSGCSLGRNIFKYQENPSYTTDNINIIQWLNEIRTS